MKKKLMAVLAVAMTVALVGCGEEAEEKKNSISKKIDEKIDNVVSDVSKYVDDETDLRELTGTTPVEDSSEEPTTTLPENEPVMDTIITIDDPQYSPDMYFSIVDMNGEVITFELDQPRSWEEYKELPDHVKIDYLLFLQKKYNAGPSMIGSMMGMSRGTIEKEMNRLKVERKATRGHRTGKQMKVWGEFLYKGYEPVPSEIAEAIDQPMPLAELLDMLRGTGAKITIELTL